MRKVTVSRMCERYAQTVLTFRITYVSMGLFHRKALLKYLPFVLRQCVLCSSIILEVLKTSIRCITFKVSQPQPNSHFITSRTRADFSPSSVLLVRRNRFAISLYQLCFVAFNFFIHPEICNVGICLFTQGCQSRFRFARRIRPGNVDG